MTFNWGWIRDKHDNRVKPLEGSGRDLFCWIKGPGQRRHGSREKKDGVGLMATRFAYAEHPDRPDKNPGKDHWRKKSLAESIHLLMVDVDDARTKAGSPVLRSTIERVFEGMLRISWSTYSHGIPGRGTNMRLVLPWARPLTPAEHDVAYTWMMAQFVAAGLDVLTMVDAQCADVTRLMFTPRAVSYESKLEDHWCEMLPGAALNPDALPGGHSIADVAELLDLVKDNEPRRGGRKERHHHAIALHRVLSGRVSVASLRAARERKNAAIQAAIVAAEAEANRPRPKAPRFIGGASAQLLRYNGIKGARTALENAKKAVMSAESRHKALLSWGRTLGGWVTSQYRDDDGVLCDLNPFDALAVGRHTWRSVDPAAELLDAAQRAYGKDFSASNAPNTIDGAMAFGESQPFFLDGDDVSRNEHQERPTASQMATWLEADGDAHRAHQAAEARGRGAIVRVCQSDFYQAEDVEPTEQTRLILLRGVQKTGKTTVLAHRIKHAQETGRPIVYVSLRRALIRDVCRRLGFESYRDARVERDIDLDNHPCLAICADSLHRILPWGDRAPALVILDECEQLARHIFGATISGSTQTTSLDVYTHLRALIETADHTIAADADIDEGTLELCRGSKEIPADCSKELWVIHPKRHERTVIMADARADLLDDLFAYLPEADGCVGVQCTSKSEAARLATILEGDTLDAEDASLGDAIHAMHARLKEQGRTLRVLLVTQDTTTNERVADFLEDNSGFEGELDVVISSPTLATGVSIDWPVARVYGIAASVRGYTSEDLAQQLWRYREVKDNAWRVWVQHRVDTYPESWGEVDARGRVASRTIKGIGQALKLQVRTDGSVVRRMSDHDHWSLYCTVSARRNRLSNHLHAGWIKLCVSRSYAVEDLDPIDKATREEIDTHRAEATAILRERHVDAVHDADQVSWEDAEAIRSRGATSDEERYQAERASVVHALSIDHMSGQVSLKKSDIEQYLDGAKDSGRRLAHHRLVRTAGTPGEDRAAAKEAIALSTRRAAKGGLWEEREGRGAALTDAVTLARLLQVAGVDPLLEEAWINVDAEAEGITKKAAKARELELVRQHGWSRRQLLERGLIEWIGDNLDRVERVMSLPSNWQARPTTIVGEVLERLGLKRKRRQVRDGDVRWYIYHLDPASKDAFRWSKAPLERHLAAGRAALSPGPHREATKAAQPEQESGHDVVTKPSSLFSSNDIVVTEEDVPVEIIHEAGRIVRADPIGDPPFSIVVGELALSFKASAQKVRKWLKSLGRRGETDAALLQRIAWGV